MLYKQSYIIVLAKNINKDPTGNKKRYKFVNGTKSL